LDLNHVLYSMLGTHYKDQANNTLDQKTKLRAAWSSCSYIRMHFHNNDQPIVNVPGASASLTNHVASVVPESFSIEVAS